MAAAGSLRCLAQGENVWENLAGAVFYQGFGDLGQKLRNAPTAVFFNETLHRGRILKYADMAVPDLEDAAVDLVGLLAGKIDYQRGDVLGQHRAHASGHFLGV